MSLFKKKTTHIAHADASDSSSIVFSIHPSPRMTTNCHCNPATQALAELEKQRLWRKRNRSKSPHNGNRPTKSRDGPNLLSLYDSLTEDDPFPTIDPISDSEEDVISTSTLLSSAKSSPIDMRSNVVDSGPRIGLRRSNTCSTNLVLMDRDSSPHHRHHNATSSRQEQQDGPVMSLPRTPARPPKAVLLQDHETNNLVRHRAFSLG